MQIELLELILSNMLFCELIEQNGCLFVEVNLLDFPPSEAFYFSLLKRHQRILD